VKILIAGGGTYGHIAPGIALFEEFQKRGDDVIYICSPKDMRYNRVINLGDKVKTIPISAFKRFDFPAKIKFFFNFIRGYRASKKIIKKFKPDVVIGAGGYVSGAPLLAVRKNKNIKKFILEQNTLPGAVNRFCSKYVDLSILTFEMSKKWMKGKSEVIGNPVLFEKKPEQISEGKKHFGINKNDFVLSIIGGSLGAKINNDTMIKILDKLDNMQLIWSTGPDKFDEISKVASSYKNVKVYPFIDQMEYLLSISALLIGRAGATSIAEICFMGVPAILIPYKYSSENHQVLNAKFVVSGGGAEMIEEDNLSPELLLQRIKFYYDNPDILSGMKKNIEGLFKADVKKEIVDRIKKEL